MAHNPILKQMKMGTSQPEIGRTQRGVLRHQGVLRTLQPNEKLSLGERWNLRHADFFLVDCREHDWKWSLKLPSADEGRTFNFMVELAYTVVQPQRVIEQNIVDLEKHLARQLNPAFQAAALGHRLNQHAALAGHLRQILTTSDAFEEAGLERGSLVKISIELSKEDKSLIEELDMLAQAQTPHGFRATRSGQLPTSEVYKFDATLTLVCQIVDPARIRRQSDLEQAVTWLWEGEILRALRPVSRRFTVRDVGSAEIALNTELENGTFEAHGIRTLTAAIDITPEARASEILVEDSELARQFDLENRKKAHETGHMRNRFEMLAQMVVRKELSLRDALAYMDGKEMEATNLPLETIRQLKALDILDIDTAADAGKALLLSTLAAATAKQNPGDTKELTQALLQSLSSGKPAPEPAGSQTDQTMEHDDSLNDNQDEE